MCLFLFHTAAIYYSLSPTRRVAPTRVTTSRPVAIDRSWTSTIMITFFLAFFYICIVSTCLNRYTGQVCHAPGPVPSPKHSPKNEIVILKGHELVHEASGVKCLICIFVARPEKLVSIRRTTTCYCTAQSFGIQRHILGPMLSEMGPQRDCPGHS